MIRSVVSAFAVAMLGCAPPPPGDDPYVPLPPDERAHRVSLALRAVRATQAEVQAVSADPNALAALAWMWMEDAAFGETVKDLHNEQMFMRNDLEPPIQPVGPLAGHTMEDLFASTSEEPLELIRHVVTSDLPYDTIVTSDVMLADARLALLYGLDRSPALGGWVETTWSDGRPQAGILTSSEVYRRHLSNGSNFHRGRANFLSTFLLCEDIGGRDVVVDGGVDLSDEFEVAAAVGSEAGCVSCHATLDPLAAHLWGFKPQITGLAINDALRKGCHWPHDDPDAPPGASLPEDFCFPIRSWDDNMVDDWALWNLPPPAYFGATTDGLVDLGRQIARDPRFAQCAARRAVGFFHQVGWRDVAQHDADRFTDVFVQSGLDYKALVHAIVTDSVFLAAASSDARRPPLGPLSVRPEQLRRTLQAVTGFDWVVDPNDMPCGTDCWNETAMLGNDRFGYRSLAGGIDSYRVFQPTWSPTPTRVLVLDRLADEAAGYAVATQFALPAAQRTLLQQVEPTTTDDDALRSAIAALHADVLGEFLDPRSPPVGATLALWQQMLAQSDPETAWEVVIAALLRDPRAEFY